MQHGVPEMGCSSVGKEGQVGMFCCLMSGQCWLACSRGLLLIIFQQLLDSCRLVVAVADFAAGVVSTC
jgi:hypothetical protein